LVRTISGVASLGTDKGARTQREVVGLKLSEAGRLVSLIIIIIIFSKLEYRIVIKLIVSFGRCSSFFALGVFELVKDNVEVEAHNHGHTEVLAEVQGLLEDEESVERWDHDSDVLEAGHFAGLGVSVR